MPLFFFGGGTHYGSALCVPQTQFLFLGVSQYPEGRSLVLIFRFSCSSQLRNSSHLLFEAYFSAGRFFEIAYYFVFDRRIFEIVYFVVCFVPDQVSLLLGFPGSLILLTVEQLFPLEAPILRGDRNSFCFCQIKHLFLSHVRKTCFPIRLKYLPPKKC